MTPETARIVSKAKRLLKEAEAMLAIDLYDAAGRTAYLSAFHAAQGLISEKSGRTVKTHHGVQMGFQALTRDDPHLDPEIRRFLSRSYNMKAIADYETDPDIFVTLELATKALALAECFIALGFCQQMTAVSYRAPCPQRHPPL